MNQRNFLESLEESCVRMTLLKRLSLELIALQQRLKREGSIGEFTWVEVWMLLSHGLQSDINVISMMLFILSDWVTQRQKEIVLGCLSTIDAGSQVSLLFDTSRVWSGSSASSWGSSLSLFTYNQRSSISWQITTVLKVAYSLCDRSMWLRVASIRMAGDRVRSLLNRSTCSTVTQIPQISVPDLTLSVRL